MQAFQKLILNVHKKDMLTHVSTRCRAYKFTKYKWSILYFDVCKKFASRTDIDIGKIIVGRRARIDLLNLVRFYEVSSSRVTHIDLLCVNGQRSKYSNVSEIITTFPWNTIEVCFDIRFVDFFSLYIINSNLNLSES